VFVEIKPYNEPLVEKDVLIKLLYKTPRTLALRKTQKKCK